MSEEKKAVVQGGASKSLVIPCATVFISSFCIMVLELVAGRVIARYLGSSLYTWTSVIGIVLAGITFGNYLGGRIADRFQAGKALAILFGISSVTCVITIVLNNLVGGWMWLWQFSWPERIFLHVSLVFFLPSTLLGTISPVVAKMALARGFSTGRTVGDIYACGAAGSIAGTFAAGYWLIATMGTVSIIWAVGGVMMLMALLYGARLWTLRVFALFFVCALVMGISPWEWTAKAGTGLWLRKKADPTLIYEDETQYCYVSVKTLGGTPEERIFMQDKLIHSSILMGNISELQYSYEQIMASITHRFSQGKDRPSFMMLGGGGYVFPRYLEKFWLGSVIDVVEIDPGVTEAAIKAFGLERTSTINTISLDARNYVDELIERKRSGEEVKRYDFIYEDALNDYSVPYQLTTYEFNEKLSQLLTDDGIYMVELIDAFNSGLFLGAFVNTLEQTFPFVAIITEDDADPHTRNTFVVIAAKRKLDIESVCADYGGDKQLRHLSDSETASLKEKIKEMVLTDDYAPVENLLAPVVLRDAESGLALRDQIRARKLAEQAEKLAWAGNLPETLAKLDELVSADAAVSVRAHAVMARIFADSGKVKEALEVYQAAVNRFSKRQFKDEMTTLHYDFGALLKKAGKSDEAMEQFRIAADRCREILAKDPTSIDSYVLLGNISTENGDFEEAVKYFQKAVYFKPGDLTNNFNLVQALESQGRLEEAIEVSRQMIEYLLKNGQQQDAAKVQQYLQFLEFKKSRPQQQKK